MAVILKMTPEQQEQCRADAAAGMTQLQLASKYDVSQSTIHRLLRIPGTPKRKTRSKHKTEWRMKAVTLRLSGMPFAQIARRLGVTEDTARRWVKEAQASC